MGRIGRYNHKTPPIFTGGWLANLPKKPLDTAPQWKHAI